MLLHAVSGLSVLLIVGMRLTPRLFLARLLGLQFAPLLVANLRFLLLLYLLSTSMCALIAIVVATGLSLKSSKVVWLQPMIACALVTGIYFLHFSLAHVICLQVAASALLLGSAAIPLARRPFKTESNSQALALATPLKLGGKVFENRVIVEFLKNDFPGGRFAPYQHVVHQLVASPDFENAFQNRVRRALFDLRYGSLWRELPRDTEWFEATLELDDLHRIRVFPRAQWRKLARGNFALMPVAQRIRDEQDRNLTSVSFQRKIEDLRAHLKSQRPIGTVLLIGRTASGPFTVLDGNHRLVAATLTGPQAIAQLRFLCGLSPKMHQCCWYQTDLGTLIRYGTNRARYSVRSSEQQLRELLQQFQISS
ncbi:MAG: hypothetical protein WBS24_01370 [Terriglobales bacterium]